MEARKNLSAHGTPYEDYLKECLADPKEAVGYLICAYNEYLKDEDLGVLLLALKDVCMAHPKVEED